MQPCGLGERVRHPTFGSGTVLSLRPADRALVRFDRAVELPTTVSRGHLLALDKTPGQAPHKTPEKTPSKTRARPRARPAPPTTAEKATALVAAQSVPELMISRDRVDVRQSLEALRLGVVPQHGLSEYTVGRHAELASLSALLDQGHGLRTLWGDYGSGKTHLLEVTEQLARSRGFATARIVLDPREVPPTNPARLYAEVARSLHLPDGTARGLEALAQALATSAAHREPDGKSFSRFLSPYLHALHTRAAEATELLRDYVHAEPIDAAQVNRQLQATGWRGPRVLTMSDYRTYGRMYLHLLGTIACWAKDAGHRGLVLLCDEVEYVDSLDSAEAQFALEVLRHFAAVTLPRSQLAFDPDGLYRGGHDVHRQLPLRYADEQPLVLVFALTPLDDVRKTFATILASDACALWLAPLTKANLDELFSKTIALYCRGYPESDPALYDAQQIRSRVLSADGAAQSIRGIVQGTVLVLDELRLCR